MLKKIKNIALIAFVFAITGCDEDYPELNTDPNRPSAEIFDPNLMFLPNVINGDRLDTVRGFCFSRCGRKYWPLLLPAEPTTILTGINMFLRQVPSHIFKEYGATTVRLDKPVKWKNWLRIRILLIWPQSPR